MSLPLFEGFANSFWDNRYTMTFSELIRSIWMRNEPSKNFQADYFSRFSCNIVGVDLERPIYEVTSEEFCQVVNNFVNKVPVRNVNYRMLLGLSSSKNIKTHVGKRSTRNILDTIKYPEHVKADLERYYEKVFDDFVDGE